MRSPFRSKFRVTQEFGKNPEYYKKFGLIGHEGLDCVPTGSVRDILSLTDGVVVRDVDDSALGKNYGKNCSIWSPSLKIAFQYCHLDSNNVKMGDLIKTGQVIGVMGATGNVTGPHLHLNYFQTDSNGIRLDTNNGYLGGVDPLPFLETNSEPVDTTLEIELNQCRLDRDRNWNWFVGLCTALGVGASYELALAEIQRDTSLKDAIVQKENQITEAKTQINELTVKLAELQKGHDKLSEDINIQAKTILEQDTQIQAASSAIAELKKLSQEPVLRGWRKRLHDWVIKS